MNTRKKGFAALILLFICVIIKWFSSNPQRVEKLYSDGFFLSFSQILRKIWGSFGFSIGDILYGLIAIWLIFKISRIIHYFLQKKAITPLFTKFKQNLYTLFIIASVFYIVFNIAWGINYNRIGIARQLDLPELNYTPQELKDMNELLTQKVNAAKQILMKNKREYPDKKKLFKQVISSYDELGKIYPYLIYETPSIKGSYWGWFGNYAGFTGYYNPFTGEAQLNTGIPKFMQPFTACHEVAHQLGYAKEMEANFVGYLAATSSADTLFHYSVYLDMFLYTNRNLFMADSLAAKVYRKKLIAPVIDDINELIRFDKKHKGALEPLIRWGYGIFLRSNEQPQGLLSYDAVTGFLIAYYKKFGKI